LLEAASMERPIITTDTTGCREIVNDKVTGFLCRVKDSIDLAEKMETMLLLSPEERQKMGKKARGKIIKEFDKQIVLDAYLKVIEDVIKNNEFD
jgi:glycosyltransferase involved in cell wall biosynthesis